MAGSRIHCVPGVGRLEGKEAKRGGHPFKNTHCSLVLQAGVAAGHLPAFRMQGCGGLLGAGTVSLVSGLWAQPSHSHFWRSSSHPHHEAGILVLSSGETGKPECTDHPPGSSLGIALDLLCDVGQVPVPWGPYAPKAQLALLCLLPTPRCSPHPDYCLN